MGKLFLNLAPGEPLALVNKLSYFDNLIELYVLLEGTFHLCIHDSISCSLLGRVEVFVDSLTRVHLSRTCTSMCLS
jgi:hypothetical protein